VTRRVCEKIAQNVAQPIFVENRYMTFSVEKVAQNIWHFSVLQKTAQIKQSPNGQKIAQIWSQCFDQMLLETSRMTDGPETDRQDRQKIS
jgi:hypothetical protein